METKLEEIIKVQKEFNDFILKMFLVQNARMENIVRLLEVMANGVDGLSGKEEYLAKKEMTKTN